MVSWKVIHSLSLVYSYVLHDAYTHDARCWDSKWGIYTISNSLAYLCEHLMLHYICTSKFRTWVCMCESVIWLPVKKKRKKKTTKRKATVRAVAVESMCLYVHVCHFALCENVSMLPVNHPKISSARPAWSPAPIYASVERCSPLCPVWGAQGRTLGNSVPPASTT